ncbi:helix-turn-helix domain-containing protein [Amaricoccus solimangrovi]|uniref:Helix-turn-helix transcriptional regulator n=1 Tax=Amaricoccus solimangrovi TaxID=2589815 RepID=A0A501WMX9_9RHOB|nr:helix-turn-helix transcriptional regulator [Amaricoccus solimangrovi]TPE50212.1 helix-turn-helix transcriptional regulator [Amaricoccus solimangrovi]
MNEIDKHVGSRMRARRERLGISQGRLGRQLGLTFSQIQKYEKGANRIGAGRLYHIAAYLDVPLTFFFEGLGGAPTGAAPLARDTEADLLMAFRAIGGEETRASVLALVRSLAALPAGAAAPE